MDSSQKPLPENLKGQFLIAMPGMPDPRFQGTVSLVCYHNGEGTMALILNRLVGTVDARQITGSLKSDIKLPSEMLRVHFGGPVMGDRGFIVHGAELDHLDSQRVTHDVSISATTDVLMKLIPHGQVPWRLVLGCASWVPGQLEAEIRNGSWLTAPATRKLIFQPDLGNLWSNTLQSIGVRSPAMLVTNTGHA